MIITSPALTSHAAAALGSAASSPKSVNSPGFGEMLQQFVAGASQSLQSSEAAAVSGLTGTASPQVVVMKTLRAEESLQAVVSIRDKLVGALNDITHMQI